MRLFGFLLLICIACMVTSSKLQGGFAAMSIDFGSKFMKIGLVKPGVPMEIVLNKESRRKTPSLIHIKDGERVFGDPAMNMAIRYPTAVYGNLLDLVAKSIDHPIVKQYLENYPHLSLVPIHNRSTVAVPFGEETYAIETVLAMILSNAREAAEAFADQTIKDVVISVPAFFNQAERLAILNAAKIAKLNLLQLINDGTAAALSYGVFRRKELSEKQQRLLIYDMGASKSVATLVEYKLAKDKKGYKEPHLTVLGIGYDRTLGGELITLRLQSLLVEKFRQSYKTQKDIASNFKAMAKMYKEAERVKQVLSANADHFAQIESVHEDIDMRLKVTREELNGLLVDLDKRIIAPIDGALEMAGLSMDQVDQIVLMGAGTRVPKVQDLLQAKIGSKELGRFLNTDEAIAIGGLYQAAFLSKGFKVKTFYVEELQIYPIQVHFRSKQKAEYSQEVSEKDVRKSIFAYKSLYPTGRKVMSFTSYKEDFSVGLHYGDLSHFSEEQRRMLGNSYFNDIQIGGLKKALDEKLNPEENEFKGVKVGFVLDYSGLVRVDGAEALIEKKPKGVVESLTNTISGFFSGEGKKDEGDTTEEKVEDLGAESAGANNQDQTSEEKETTKKSEEKNEEKTTEKEKVEDKVEKIANKTESAKGEKDIPAVTKVKLSVTRDHKDVKPVSADEIKSSIKLLERFEKEEILRAERHHAENELEAYAFEASTLLDEENFILHSNEAERQKLQTEVTRIRAWLEDDTQPSTPTKDFKENYKTLKNIVEPVNKRISETQNRPVALDELEKLINTTIGLITLTRANFTETTTSFDGKEVKAMNEEINTFSAKIDKLVNWLTDTKKAQSNLSVNEDSILKTEEIKSKTSALQRAFAQHFQKMSRLTDDVIKARKKAEREAKKKAAAKEEKEDTETKEEPNQESKDKDSETTDKEKIEL